MLSPSQAQDCESGALESRLPMFRPVELEELTSKATSQGLFDMSCVRGPKDL